jgi:hypothetical protein
MTSNSIYYRFLSEKKKYTINFDTNEISIADIKKEIKTRRNIDKVPENFELLIFNENTADEIRDDNIKINPLQMLIIKRIPHYKLNANFMETITDPSEISAMRFVDINFLNQKRERAKISPFDPIEKILTKINFEFLVKKLNCLNCLNSDGKFFILKCCGESICEICKNSENFFIKENCKFCNEIIKGYMDNNKIEDFKERIISINLRKLKENEEAINEINNNILMQQNSLNLNNNNELSLALGLNENKQKNFYENNNNMNLHMQMNMNNLNNNNNNNYSLNLNPNNQQNSSLNNYGNFNRIQGKINK